MRDVLRKWTPREKYVKYQNFPTLFGVLLSLERSGKISRNSVESAYPVNSLKVDVFLLKSYARFSLVKVREQLAPRLIKPQTNGTTGHPSVREIGQDFPGEASHCNTFFISLSRVVFVFFTQGLFSAVDFSIRVSVKSFHVGILSST